MITPKNSSSTRLCPLCKTAPVCHDFRPFCSDRCKKIDLNRWFSEVYAVPSEEDQNLINGHENEPSEH